MIVGGHSHDVLNGVVPGKNLVTSPTGAPVLIVQAGKNASYMGVADLMVTPQGTLADAKNYLYDPHQFPRNPFAQKLEEQFLGPSTTLATISNKYDNDNNAFEPDPVAELTADTLRSEANSDIAFVRSASVRKSLWPGAFTNHDLHELMPFKDQQVALPLTGQEILDVLSKSAQTVMKGQNHPGFINASGLSYTFNKQTGAVSDVRVFNRQANQWEPLNPQQTYRVACDEFSVTNPSEFPSLGHPERIDWKSGRAVGTFFEQGLKLKGAPNNPVTLQCDGRSRVI